MSPKRCLTITWAASPAASPVWPNPQTACWWKHIHTKHQDQEITSACTVWCEEGVLQATPYLKPKSTSKIRIIVMDKYLIQCNHTVLCISCEHPCCSASVASSYVRQCKCSLFNLQLYNRKWCFPLSSCEINNKASVVGTNLYAMAHSNELQGLTLEH